MENLTWYHGGDFKDGKPKGTYVYVTDSRQLAAAHARAPEHPNGALYRLRPEYHHLVTDHEDGSGRKVIRQVDLRKLGGVLCVFEKVK